MKINNDITWNNLYDSVDSDEESKKIDKLKSLLEIKDIKFLLTQFSRLEKPENIQRLTTYQKKQQKLGAWVKGILPDQFVDKNLVIPDEFPNKLDCLLQLAEQRKANLEALEAMGEYTINFENHDIKLDISNTDIPDDWELTIDLSVMEKTLDLFNNDPVRKDALEVANLEANQQMLKHRRNLGYLPEPITDTEDLTELLLWAASDKPEDLIWKWLHPMNIFELADVYNQQSEFKDLYKKVKNNKESLKMKILSKINEYIKKDLHDLNFNETFSFTFGYAIRGWATDDMFGVNIENIKDDYDKLISTIAHELFHRLQTKLCSTEGNQTFADLVNGHFDDEKDNKFYEILSYIMVEGTGEYITHQFIANKGTLKVKAKQGLELLDEVYRLIYVEEEMEKAEKLLNQGLKSNGVFYSLGEYITECLIEEKEKSYLGEILSKGVNAFFLEGDEVTNSLKFSDQILSKIYELK